MERSVDEDRVNRCLEQSGWSVVKTIYRSYTSGPVISPDECLSSGTGCFGADVESGGLYVMRRFVRRAYATRRSRLISVQRTSMILLAKPVR